MRIPATASQIPRLTKGIDKQMRKAIDRGIKMGAVKGRTLLMRRTPVDQGQMKAAWHFPVKATDVGTRTPAYHVMNDAPYAGIVEAGARPHPVSAAGQQAIIEWVRRHFGFMRTGRGRYSVVSKREAIPGRVAKPRTKLSQSALGQMLMDESLVKIARAIIRKIETQGQKPTYFIRDSRPELERFVVEEVVRALQAMRLPSETGAR